MVYKEFLKKVILGEWEYEESGYVVYTVNNDILSYISLPEEKPYLVDCKVIEDLLYDDCCRAIDRFAQSEDNKDVYAFTLFIDTDGGVNGASINTESSYKTRVNEVYSDCLEEELKEIWGERYNEGDFTFRYYSEDFVGPKLKEIMDAYYCINQEHPILDVSMDIAFESNLFEERLIQVGINVVRRLSDKFKVLNRTDDFIAYVSLHDVGADIIGLLMQQTVSIKTFEKLFPNYK